MAEGFLAPCSSFFFFTGPSNSSFSLSPNSFRILSLSAFNGPSTTHIRSTIRICHWSSIRVLTNPSKMRNLVEDFVDALSKVKIAPKMYNWLFSCHGFWHNALLMTSSMLFVLYLGVQAKKSFSKLSHGRSYIMMSYYGSLWLVSFLNLVWCWFQVIFRQSTKPFSCKITKLWHHFKWIHLISS